MSWAKKRRIDNFQTRLSVLEARLIAAADIIQFVQELHMTAPMLAQPFEAVQAVEVAEKAATRVLGAGVEAAMALQRAIPNTTDAVEGAEITP